MYPTLVAILGKGPAGQAYALIRGAAVAPSQHRPQATRGRLVLPPGLAPLQPPHLAYLRGRGFDPGPLAKLWGLMGTGPVGGMYAWRVYAPYVLEGEVVGWVGRSIGGADPLRYVFSTDDQSVWPVKGLLYGEDYAATSVIIVEGPADVWRVGPGAVALGGLTWTHAQVHRLVRFPYRTICFDKEPKAQRAARALANQLASWPGETHVIELDAEDPGKASQAEVDELRGRCGLGAV